MPCNKICDGLYRTAVNLCFLAVRQNENEMCVLNDIFPDENYRLNLCNQINWTAAVETLLRATGLNEQDRTALLLSDMPVSLQCRDFLPELSTLLSTTPSR